MDLYKRFFIIIFASVFISIAGSCSAFADNGKPRIIVLTDIENEPDDAMSLIRFLCYSNQWDVEGLIATTSVHQQHKTAAWRIREIVRAYGKVRNNLLKHEEGFPSMHQLLSVTKEGRADYGMGAVGSGMDSEGSEWIIRTLDKKDPRPVWVLVWGGTNCLAQALWKVRETRTESQCAEFVKRLRVYAISDQDDSAPWIRRNLEDLFYIASPGYFGLGAYHYATWTGISGDRFNGRFAGADFDIVDNPWLDRNIRSKGPLGAEYPYMEYLMEGDSPSFLYLVDNGLGVAERPDWGSWGGRYEYYQPRTERWFAADETRPFWTDAVDEVMGIDGCWHTSNKATIWRWREAYQNDFSARMDWTIKEYTEANHPPVVNMDSPSHIKAKVGDKLYLSVESSVDPDGDNLDFKWYHYPEAGTFAVTDAWTGNPLTIDSDAKGKASFVVPRSARYGTIHIIAEVRDDGEPSLTRYGRFIIEVENH